MTDQKLKPGDRVSIAPKWEIMLFLFDLVEAGEHENPKSVRDLFEDAMAILDNEFTKLLEVLSTLEERRQWLHGADPEEQDNCQHDFDQAVSWAINARHKCMADIAKRRRAAAEKKS